MNTLQERMIAQIAATNKAHSYAQTLKPLLIAAFTPLVGQKIEKADGKLMEKFKKLLPFEYLENGHQFQKDNGLSVYKVNSNYSLAWVVKACEQLPPTSCVYYETTIYVGDIRGGILTKMFADSNQLRTDYTLEELERNVKAYKDANELMETARSACFPFTDFLR
jgi:hypothetical protein